METEWRCSGCGLLLGKVRGGRVHVEFARGHRYSASLPITAVCRRCERLNEWEECLQHNCGKVPTDPAVFG